MKVISIKGSRWLIELEDKKGWVYEEDLVAYMKQYETD